MHANSAKLAPRSAFPCGRVGRARQAACAGRKNRPAYSRLVEHPDGKPFFETTLWNVVLCAREKGDPAAASALEQLCRIYWYPLYAYARRRGLDAQTAEDAVQELFLNFIERQSLAGVSPKKGRFRSFLLTSLNRLLIEQHSRQTAIKRGGRLSLLSFDEMEPEERYRLEPADGSSPDRLFDRRCALAVLEKALVDLRADYESHEQQAIFAELNGLLLEKSGATDYAAIGERLGLSEGAVKMQVLRLRQRFQAKVRATVADTLDDTSQTDAELEHLLAALI